MAGAFRLVFADLFLLDLFFFERAGVATVPRVDAPVFAARVEPVPSADFSF